MTHHRYASHAQPSDYSKILIVRCLAICLVVVAVGCNEGDSTREVLPYTYQMPAQTGDGWQVGHIQDVGIDGALLTQAMDSVRRSEPGFRLIDSIVIVKEGLLVFDELTRTRLDQFDADVSNRNIEIHTLRSVSKTFASTLIGIAIDQGFIPSVDAPINDFFAHKQPIANWDQVKQSITLEDWLTMRHGYAWEEEGLNYYHPSTVSGMFERADDSIQYLLDLPMANNPGEVFEYSTGVSYALGRLIQVTTGQSVTQFMELNLFQPLGIQEYDYLAMESQLHTGLGLYLSTRDIAKLGQLFLDGGVWNGQRVISENWVNIATQPHHEFDTGHDGYGYQWWTHDFEYQGNFIHSYRANGFGGQHIIVIPNLSLVIALTGRAYTEEQLQERGQVRIVQDYILPSIM